VLQGTLLYLRHDAAGARRSYERALALNPGHLEALSDLTALDLAEHKTEAALRRVDAAAGSHGSDPAFLALAARTHAATGDRTGAEALLQRVLKTTPSDQAAYSMLAQVYAADGKLPEARAQVQAMLKANPKFAAGQTLLGMLFEMDHMPADAQRAYEAALAADPKSAVAANNLAAILADGDRDMERAFELARNAKAALPDSPSVDDTLGWIYYKRNMLPLAVAALERSVAANGTDAVPLFHLGMAYARAGDKGKARQTLQKALQLDPGFTGSADARKTLATLGS
jgi:tetratricopeptide (TPR) repeat protein